MAFGGITDRLIPLFAIGALLAFTLSQVGMVQHWRRIRGRRAAKSMIVNGAGATATAVTLLVVTVSKFVEGAWLVVAVMPLLVLLFVRIHRYYDRVAEQISTVAPMKLPVPRAPIAVLAAGAWNKVTQHGLSFALRLSSEIHASR